MIDTTDGKFALTSNGYISIGLAVMIGLAYFSLKDGQSVSVQTAKDVRNELAQYKEIQKLSADLLVAKIDVLAKSVEAATADRWTTHDAKAIWKRFKEMNSANTTLKIPEP